MFPDGWALQCTAGGLLSKPEQSEAAAFSVKSRRYHGCSTLLLRTHVLHHLSDLLGPPSNLTPAKFQQATRKMKGSREILRALEQLRRTSGQTSSCSRLETSTN